MRRKFASLGRRDVPIAWLLALVLGTLMVLAIVPVSLLGYFVASDNTSRLLRDGSEATIGAVVDRIAAHLNPVREQLVYVSEAVRLGVLDPGDPAAMRAFILGALASTPQVTGILHIGEDYSLQGYARSDFGSGERSIPKVPRVSEAIADARKHEGPYWVDPIWSPLLRQTIITLRAPLYRANRFDGMLVAAITTAELSRYMGAIEAEIGRRPFILVGGGRVLAHPALAARDAAAKPGDGETLPLLAAIGDPILTGLWTGIRNPLTAVAPLQRSEGHWTRIGGDPYVVVHRQVEGYGEPWTVGVYFSGYETQRERWMVTGLAIAGGLSLLLGLATAVVVARLLSRPVLRLADAARRIEALEFDSVRALGRSRSREVNEAFGAFEHMANALRWFETYLPRALVRRLMAAGKTSPKSETRNVTIMFADLQDYSGFSAGKPALEVAEYLNNLLARVGPLIEASGGTIDKYLGDGVMAFWGAPDERPDHAEIACRAALQGADAVVKFNQDRRAAGLPCCRMRIGVHSGPVVVGNVGFAGRMDYTIIGEAVNTARRIQELGRGCPEGPDAIVLVSPTTHSATADHFAFEAIETAASARRVALTTVYRLVGARGSAAGAR